MGRMNRSNLGGLRVKFSPTKVTLVTIRFQPFRLEDRSTIPFNDIIYQYNFREMIRRKCLIKNQNIIYRSKILSQKSPFSLDDFSTCVLSIFLLEFGKFDGPLEDFTKMRPILLDCGGWVVLFSWTVRTWVSWRHPPRTEPWRRAAAPPTCPPSPSASASPCSRCSWPATKIKTIRCLSCYRVRVQFV